MARKKEKKKEEESGFSRMLAGTIALGIVFSAGLITGQRLLRAEARAPMVSLSTTRQAPAATDPTAAKPSLRTTFSFYEHLTQDAEATSPPPAGEPAAVKPPEVTKPSVVQPEAKPVDPVVAMAQPSIQAAPAPAKPAAEAKAGPLKQVLNEVVESLSPSDAKPKPDVALAARYTLQVSSHPDRQSAEREVARLTQMGVEPHLVVVNVPGKGELWRVRVGKFHTMDEARDFQGSVKTRRGIPGFVTPL